jgi:endo-1,4-beta-mannosidase
MTGESNINTNYPDFLAPFTMAHEMAHQRGIAREDEANFVAFLVCIGSDDAYIRYSGYTNVANYIANALNTANYNKYVDMMVNHYPTEVMKEFVAYSDFFDEYRDSTASEVTGVVNNAFLQSQGQSAGTKSYGLVVDLAVAYYK